MDVSNLFRRMVGFKMSDYLVKYGDTVDSRYLKH